MEEDEKAVQFSDAVFTKLWQSQNITPQYISLDNDFKNSEFIDEVSRTILVLSSLTAPTISKQLETFFNNNILTRKNVFTFTATYCFEYHSKNDDIFEVILNTCTFVYRTMLYCYDKGKRDFIDFASLSWTDIFNYDLKDEFYDKGGWIELERYVKINCNIPGDKADFKSKYMDLLNDISNFFMKCVESEEDCMSSEASSLNASAEHTSEESFNEPTDLLDFSSSSKFVSTSMCEAKITVEEAVSAYKLLTSFYGQDLVKFSEEDMAGKDMSSDIIDIEHVYKTLKNFINQGIYLNEPLSKIPPDVITDANIHKALLYGRNDQCEEHAVINENSLQAILYLSSLVSKILPDDSNLGQVEHDSQLNNR